MRASIQPSVKHYGLMLRQSTTLSHLRELKKDKCLFDSPSKAHLQIVSKLFSISTEIDQGEPILLNDSESASAGFMGNQVRVRFAPSPTGNLHVGGARTALFNWLLARNSGGKFVLRIEDTDTSRSTRESEEAVLRDLKWLGMEWDEGPDIGGDYGPYRQSERTDIYMRYVEKLVVENKAYPCFCTDGELEAMRKDAEAKKLAPIYRGPWATADEARVKEMLEKKVPFCYRFRVPKGENITVPDAVRGNVTWNTDTLGDFVIMRSNGFPVYNFCVAIDDALMKISHVIRAEEHLPNTLRQLLIYRALGFNEPIFGHVSLILAPDKSKLSKRHGATSVGEFKEEGYLPAAMINYLSMLGWNDGTEQEIYTVEELKEKISIERITKSAAVFDKTKLSWMNGQHLRALPFEEVKALISEDCLKKQLLHKTEGEFFEKAVRIVQESIELVPDASEQLHTLFSYPLTETLASEKAAPILEDGLKEFFEVVLAKFENGSLADAIKDDASGFQDWVKAFGKEQKRKTKRLYMPMRIALTGSMAGPDIGKIMSMIDCENGEVIDRDSFFTLDARMKILRDWVANN